MNVIVHGQVLTLTVEAEHQPLNRKSYTSSLTLEPIALPSLHKTNKQKQYLKFSRTQN